MFNLKSNQGAIIVSISIWTVLIGVSSSWNVIDQKSHVVELATIAARENFNKDQAFRLWGSRHGGVYVPPNERTPPNPALAHIPNRDIVTEDGTKLTLMNPAYMLRQMMNEYAELYGIRAKVTGLVLLNPINAPDDWEINALHKFEKGIKEITEQSTIDGKPFLRFMRPMFMKKSCMKCHGHLGFKVGDLRGGVGVAVPLEPYIKSGSKSVIVMWLSHGIIWILGVVTILILLFNRKQRDIEKQKSYILKQDVLNAEKASQAKSEFLSRMSHELRTPLNAILGFGQMLELDESELSDVQNMNVKEILDAGHHLLNLINEILNLAQIESGKVEINMDKVDFTQLLQECLKLMSNSIEVRNIEVVDNISEQRYFVNADFMRLKQIFLNLISNAVKYNKEYGRLIFDSKMINKHRVRICVTDTGAGLTEEEVSRLFNPFERLNAEENIEGTGIGLTIIKHLGQLMDLGIGVESTPGKGSTFWVELELVL